jgi:protein tyrosine/serine phosphatase
MRIAITLGGFLFVVAALWLTVETRRNRLVWDHFDVVKPGVLYRSGQLNGDQLAEVVARYGIRTLVNVQVPGIGRGVETERIVARRLGIDYVNLPMPGDGFGEEAQFREVLKACDDPARRPVLVHCARGTCRTGAAVALYRFERDGWTIDDVAAEMKHQTYREGWLPGYVYGMVHSRPGQDLYEPPITIDRNLPPSPPRTSEAGATTATPHQAEEPSHVR